MLEMPMVGVGVIIHHPPMAHPHAPLSPHTSPTTHQTHALHACPHTYPTHTLTPTPCRPLRGSCRAHGRRGVGGGGGKSSRIEDSGVGWCGGNGLPVFTTLATPPNQETQKIARISLFFLDNVSISGNTHVPSGTLCIVCDVHNPCAQSWAMAISVARPLGATSCGAH